jgi:hypothetical protein
MVLDPCEIGPPVVQLMIFDGWGLGGWGTGWGEREIKTTSSIWRGNLYLSCIKTTWTNCIKFWHQNELKKHSMAKRACREYLETVLRNNLGEMQRNVTM